MSETKFTKGEWRAFNTINGQVVKTGEGLPEGGTATIATINNGLDNKYANAQLITAAPDYHAVCEMAFDLIGKNDADSDIIGSLVGFSVYLYLEKAIAKPRGENA